ncbi:tetratricopeptide repeat protein [Microlunatus sp. Y2014]|uniref:tetratricopeptide repeat protein n=1 Tax=Microlunatus sp. Y2014 TaxID=3418488 RepID=UPI003DA742ED
MPRNPIPADVRQRLGRLLQQAQAAAADGNADEARRRYEALWAEVPQPWHDYELRAIADNTVRALIGVGDWEGASKWQPVKAEQYGEADPSVRVSDAIVSYRIDPASGQPKLAAVLDDFGAEAFSAYPDYVAVAEGKALPFPGPEVPADALELPEALGERIDELSEAGSDALYAEDWDEAIGRFEQALELVPDPKREWEAATWLYASIGDAHLGAQRWKQARNYFQLATQSPGGIENPYVQMRLGQSEYELGNHEAAERGLITAYMTEGEKIFAEEPPKYLAFLGERGLLKRDA